MHNVQSVLIHLPTSDKMDALSFKQSEAFKQLDEQSKIRMLHVIDAIESTKGIFAQTSVLPTILEPMVEAAVRRALVETRKAPKDLTSYTGESGAEGFTVATTTARVPANHCTHLTKEYLSTISVGPKKHRTEKQATDTGLAQ